MERISPERLATAKRQAATDPPPDLNDEATLEALLNMAVLDATKILTGPEAGRDAMLDGLERDVARILLGYERVVPRAGWNCPGGIDAHCNEQLNLSTEGPMTRMRLAVERMIGEIGIPEGTQGRTGQLPPNWQDNCDKAVARYLALFSGLPLPA